MVAMSCEQFEARYDDSADYARAHHHDSAHDDSANTRPAWARPLPLPQRRGEAQGEGHEGARRALNKDYSFFFLALWPTLLCTKGQDLCSSTLCTQARLSWRRSGVRCAGADLSGSIPEHLL